MPVSSRNPGFAAAVWKGSRQLQERAALGAFTSLLRLNRRQDYESMKREELMGRIGSVMGAIKIAHQGPQNHNPTFGEIEDRFFGAYGYRF